ncbi:MAG: hypothetical protein JNK82_15820 [Myxococcaceae bacterium]|nr:hypothetical protein [Myxococcaceae bacterium]
MIALLMAAVLSQSPDVGGLYDLTTEGSTLKVKAGEKGKLVLDIRAKSGAHISDEAPLKIELKATGAKTEKDKLTYKDSIGVKHDGVEYPDPHFEVPFTSDKPGKASIEAKMKFFVCTDKVCAPQTKTVTVPVDVI